jgi:hypothetical protein
MFIKIIACIIGGVSLYCIVGTMAQEYTTVKYISIPSADSSIKKVVDSTKCIRDTFVAQKDSLKDKINHLQWQQRQIKDTQRQIDSINTWNVIFTTLQVIMK